MKRMLETQVEADVGWVFVIAGSRYIALSGESYTVKSSSQQSSLATVFTLSGDSEFKVTLDYIRQRVNAYIEVDDIFHNAFLAAVVFQAPEADAFSTTDDALEYLQGPGTNCIINARSADLLPRPYALIGNQLRDVWKLIDDINGTCMVTLKPQSRASDAFETFPIKGTDDRFSSFTLQSRIKTQAKSEAALADMRILVKDNIHLKGVETSVGTKAFYDTCPKQE